MLLSSKLALIHIAVQCYPPEYLTQVFNTYPILDSLVPSSWSCYLSDSIFGYISSLTLSLSLTLPGFYFNYFIIYSGLKLSSAPNKQSSK